MTTTPHTSSITLHTSNAPSGLVLVPVQDRLIPFYVQLYSPEPCPIPGVQRRSDQSFLKHTLRFRPQCGLSRRPSAIKPLNAHSIRAPCAFDAHSIRRRLFERQTQGFFEITIHPQYRTHSMHTEDAHNTHSMRTQDTLNTHPVHTQYTEDCLNDKHKDCLK